MELVIENYKKSQFGRIPNDWNEFSIGKIVKNIIDYRGVTPKKLGMDWGGGDIVALSAGNVKKGYIDFNSECYYGSDSLYKRWMRNGDVAKNDIVFTLEAPLGNIALIPDNKKYILSQRTILLQLNEEFWSPYIYQLLLSNIFQNYISASATGSTAQGIKRTTFEKLNTVIPPTITEQKAIATALSDVDELIANLDKLITKKKAIKQGAMQQLLTPPHKGGKRLAGFIGEWVEKKLGEFCEITTGKLDANAMVPDGDYRFYTCARKFYFIDKFAFNTEALLVSGNGANVGYVHYYKGKFNAYQRTYVLDEFSSNIHFIKCLLDKYLPLRIDSEKNDGNTPYIKMDTLTEMSLNLPPNKNEQQAIAQILADMDSEIEQLETKRAKYKDIKQGMMQELLTGKTRLV